MGLRDTGARVNASVFLIPAGFGGRSDKAGIKNGDERLVILNNLVSATDSRGPVLTILKRRQT